MDTTQSADRKAVFFKGLFWLLTLFGTAVGAGILFLPIEAGVSGLIPVFIMTVLIGPIIFFAHDALGNVSTVTQSSTGGAGQSTVSLFHGPEGAIILLVYVASIFPMLLVYGLGLTNTVYSFLIHHNVMVSHGAVATISVLFVSAVVAIPQKKLVPIAGVFVWPLLIVLLFFMIYLSKFWTTAVLYGPSSSAGMLKALWLMLPILIFTFNHLSAISACVQDCVGSYGPEKGHKLFRRVELWTVVLLVVFTMGFAISVILSLTPAKIIAARHANLPVLAYMAIGSKDWILAIGGPIIAVLAITSSYIGFFIGARGGIVDLFSGENRDETRRHHIGIGAYLFVAVSVWLSAFLNLDIATLIDDITGPIIALMLLVFPVYAYYRLPALAPFRKQRVRNFILVAVGFSTVAIALFHIFR